MAPPLFAKLVRIGGGKLLDRAVAQFLPPSTKTSSRLGKGLTGAALTRIATRSVPGAIVVGGGIIAKMLYDRRHARQAPPAKDSASDPATEDDADAIG